MLSGIDICVVGAADRTAALAGALSTGGLSCRSLTPRQAVQRPGAFLGADIVVWCHYPWAHPMPEAEAYASGAVSLYVRWGDSGARIGPVTMRGRGPCPRCVGSSDHGPLDGHDPLLAAWVSSWAALECDALLTRGNSSLVGMCWSWGGGTARLSPATFRRDASCALPGCG